MRDPIVIDPPGFDPRAGWQECSEYVDKCGGLSHEDGSFGADPGCCSCPKCGEMYWSWGTVAECLDCHFRFPTNWWAAYSWGVQAAKRDKDWVHQNPSWTSYLKEKHAASIGHPYYRYGYEHPVEDAWKEHDKIPWAEVVGPMDKYPEGVRLGI